MRSPALRLQRARDLLERDDAAQAAVGVDRHQRAEAAQRLGAEQRLERRVGAHLAVRAGGATSSRDRACVAGLVSAACSTAARWASPTKRPSSSTTANHGQPW